MEKNSLTALQAIGSGVAGACTLTLLHESLRRIVPNAPRMDLLGMQVIAKSMEKINQPTPGNTQLHQWALVGDIISNSFYYSLASVGSSKKVWLRAAALGLGAGIGGVVLPGRLGLDNKPSARTLPTKLMTIAWYLAGGLATAVAVQFFAARNSAK